MISNNSVLQQTKSHTEFHGSDQIFVNTSFVSSNIRFRRHSFRSFKFQLALTLHFNWMNHKNCYHDFSFRIRIFSHRICWLIIDTNYVRKLKGKKKFIFLDNLDNCMPNCGNQVSSKNNLPYVFGNRLNNRMLLQDYEGNCHSYRIDCVHCARWNNFHILYLHSWQPTLRRTRWRRGHD